ncbi:MAG: FKBP-type peptidyl-prolyl cis-trans isomerase [Chitinispirillales bacterium]|jgi:FKBP-type peptidyl-prolyl cis-trans isomerase|nr:FKBP-type peptidyl-prolyl cis-trans isomerase [Chitinispirillales bacterium]
MKKVLLASAAAAALSFTLISCDSMNMGKTDVNSDDSKQGIIHNAGRNIGKREKTKVNLDDPKHEVSYMVGRDIGKSLKNLDSDVDLRVIFAAIREVMEDTPSKLSDSALAAIGTRFNQELRAKAEEKRQKELEVNKADGEIFLAANKEIPGVVVTESGLQYQVITEGTGAAPTAEDRVKVHYHGTLINGTVFDSSIDRGEPAVFGVGQVIRGWTEALQLMKVGSKYKIVVPSDLAYGERGARPPVGPNTTLIFEVELLEIVK